MRPELLAGTELRNYRKFNCTNETKRYNFFVVVVAAGAVVVGQWQGDSLIQYNGFRQICPFLDNDRTVFVLPFVMRIAALAVEVQHSSKAKRESYIGTVGSAHASVNQSINVDLDWIRLPSCSR